ncbi:hypothetical protein [Pukyongiella litopenaei]|uniref:Uncharacterized protein n=1 Tax=Pukyongiella litopenaei TaxID=2605946 RepID=A0A2S0ML01_9RHOB|nr:hypothetical protein [Pukyongiella litopenaei]AVO36546.2 hypothetical protein C6Y53_01735 [Pukyongiella litopenaei]
MTNCNADSANNTGLTPVTVDAPGLTYSFYRESDADLTTMEGRLEWFCANFEVSPPNLEYDEDEPDAILLTDDLMRWALYEGVSLDWLVCGMVSGVLAEFRKGHSFGGPKRKLYEIIRKLDDAQKQQVLDSIEAKSLGLRELHHQWRIARDTYNESAALDGTPEGAALFDRILELEQQAADYEPQSVEDFAFKIIIADCDGDMNVTDCQVELANMAYRVAGIEQVCRGVIKTR